MPPRPAPVVLLLLLGACTSGQLVVPEGERLTESGRSDYRAALEAWIADDAATARERLDDLRAVEPWYVPAHVLWQEATEAVGAHDEAVAWYRARRGEAPDDALRVLLDGRLTERTGGAREAAYRRAVELDPVSPWPRLALSYELNRAALAAFEESIALADQGYSGASSERRGRAAQLHDESSDLAERVVAEYPQLAEAAAGAAEVLLTRGAALGERSTLQRALELAERAAALDPAHPGRHALVARVRRALIDDPGAEVALRKALELDPEDPLLLAGLGRVLLDLGRPAEALDVLSSARAARPDDALIRADLGVAAQRTGDLDRARAELLRAAELAPDDPRPLESLALVEIERGDRAAARQALREYVDRGGEDRAWAEATIGELAKQP